MKDGIPEPSTIRPFLISRSYAIGFLRFGGSVQFHSPRTISRRPDVAGLSYRGKGGSGMRGAPYASIRPRRRSMRSSRSPRRSTGNDTLDPAVDLAQIGFQPAMSPPIIRRLLFPQVLKKSAAM